MNKLLAVLAVSGLAWGLAACSPPPPISPLGKNDVVLAFGDSLTAGAGAAAGQGYPAQLQKIIGRTVVAAGVRGETSAGALARLTATLRQIRPKLLVVCIGGNDFLRRMDAEQTRRNVRQIAQIAREHKVPLVLVAVPRLFFFPINHPLYRSVAAEYGLWLEDEVLKEVLFDNRLKSDTIHPNAQGYLKIALAVAATLRRSGAIQ